MQTSDSNDILSAIEIADDKAPNGAGVAPLLVLDQNGRSKHGAAKAWITGQPDAEYADEAKPREWKLECSEIVDFTGGN